MIILTHLQVDDVTQKISAYFERQKELQNEFREIQFKISDAVDKIHKLFPGTSFWMRSYYEDSMSDSELLTQLLTIQNMCSSSANGIISVDSEVAGIINGLSPNTVDLALARKKRRLEYIETEIINIEERIRLNPPEENIIVEHLSRDISNDSGGIVPLIIAAVVVIIGFVVLVSL